jgi:hypothetical protein
MIPDQTKPASRSYAILLCAFQGILKGTGKSLQPESYKLRLSYYIQNQLPLRQEESSAFAHSGKYSDGPYGLCHWDLRGVFRSLAMLVIKRLKVL